MFRVEPCIAFSISFFATFNDAIDRVGESTRLIYSGCCSLQTCGSRAMFQTDMSAKLNYSMRVFYATVCSDCLLLVSHKGAT